MPRREPGGANPVAIAAAAETAPVTLLQRDCAVCGRRQGRTLGNLHFALLDGTGLADEYDVVTCANCGLVTSDSRSNQDDYDRFYAGYEYSPAALATGITPDDRKYFGQLFETLSPYLRSGPVLDIGCGNGKLLKYLRSSGLNDLYATDLSAACVAALRDDGIAAAVGSAAALPFADLRPRVVVMNHVVEHILALPESLESVRRRLATGGVVYVEVPDTAQFDAAAAETPLKFFYPQHVIHLDPQHLDNLFRANGFRCRAHGTRVRVEGELEIPACWAVYSVHSGGDPISPDFTTASLVKSWFDDDRLDQDGSFSRLARARSRVFIWGIGIHVELMLGMSPLRRCNIACCVDQNPRLHGRKIGGHTIASTEELRNAGAEDTIVIGARVHRRKMLKILRDEFGFRGRVLAL